MVNLAKIGKTNETLCKEKTWEKMSEGKWDGFDKSHLLPFMNPSEIKDLFYDKLKNINKA